MNQPAPTIFESFNARALNPSQVARTFVPSKQYQMLAKRRHTMVIGPRGSGKTTLLKMLQQPALEAWPHRLADDYRQTIDFTGVFIPTDLSWGQQIEALGEGKLDSDTHRLLSKAVFTTHVLRALTVAMLNRITNSIRQGIVPFRRVKAEKRRRPSSQNKSRGLHLGSLFQSLLGIKYAYKAQAFKMATGDYMGLRAAQRLAEISWMQYAFRNRSVAPKYRKIQFNAATRNGL
jgi:hypothetical protein